MATARERVAPDIAIKGVLPVAAVSASPGGAPLLMSMADIAELAGVQRPVVTTWRRRHADFPKPMRENAGRPLFDADAVCGWLVDTGRAEREAIEPDLCLYSLSAFDTVLPPRQLVAAVTALVCLHHLDGEPLADSDLRARASAVDPDDERLGSEVAAVPDELPGLVDDLVEAAWGCAGAFERIMRARGRFAARELTAQAVDAQLARLIVELSGTRARAGSVASLVLADPAAGAGDLLVPALGSLPEGCAPVVHAAEPDRYLARLLRRRLTVHGVPPDDQHVVASDAGLPDDLDDPDVIITQIPYQPAEQRTPDEVLDHIDNAGILLAPDRTAGVLGPADVLTGTLPRYSTVERARAKLLSDGMVEAIVRLPAGLIPFRPGYETALWVLTSAHDSPLRGRVLVCDLSGSDLTSELVDTVVTDVVTWRRRDHRRDTHTLVRCAQVDVATLVDSAGPLLATRPPTIRERRTEVPAAVAAVASLERALADLAAMPRPAVRTELIQAIPATPEHTTVGALIRSGRLILVHGVRLAGTELGDHGQHRVIGSDEVRHGRLSGRWIDRAVLAERYPQAELTEPGDVVVTAGGGMLIDHDGFAVVEYPARALRIPASRRDRLTPRLLAALLQTGPGTRRIEDRTIPLLPPALAASADALLARLDARRGLAEQELAAIDDMRRIASVGLANGTLTVQPEQEK